MLETILSALAVAGTVGKIWLDRSATARKKADDAVRYAARAIIPRVIALLGDDRERAWTAAANLIAGALTAVHVDFTGTRREMAHDIFDQLWAANGKEVLDAGTAALATAGGTAARIADWLLSPASDPFASLRADVPPATAILSADARRIREAATR